MSVCLYLSHNLRKILQYTSPGWLSSPLSLQPLLLAPLPPCPDPCCSICLAASMQLTFALSESYTHSHTPPDTQNPAAYILFFIYLPLFLFRFLLFVCFLYFCMHYSGVGGCPAPCLASVCRRVLSPASFLAGWRRQSPCCVCACACVCMATLCVSL